MLRTLMTSPKQLHVIFPNGKQSSVTTNEIFTADNFHKHLKALLPSNLYLHIKISSLSYHIDNLNSLITNCQVKPKTIGISDSRLKKNKKFFQTLIQKVITLNIQSSKGRTLICIDNNFRYKMKNDLKISKSKKIEPTLIEIIEGKSKNKIIQ